MQNILNEAPLFLKKLFKEIQTNQIDVTKCPLDHLCYRVETLAEYEVVKEKFGASAKLLQEAQIAGRSIATYKLREPIRFQAQGESRVREILYVEIPAPKAGKRCATGWEHAEFVIEESFREFKRRYPNVVFDESGVQKSHNPELELEFAPGLAVKFHHMTLEEVINKKEIVK